jgi:NitT/TauT family transport system ATP-binding protein
VSKSFGNVHALTEIDLAIQPGEFFTLLGPSGSGKTTLLRIIAGLEAASSGEVVIEEGTPAAARAAKRFGWVPQSPALLPWRTVTKNVTLLTEVNKRAGNGHPVDAEALVRQVGLAGFENSLPHQLSGGMQQRVALVRAFALGAPILLMDEPFAALDEITRFEMRHVLLDLWQNSGTAVVFVTHSLDEAAYLSDRVAVLSARPGRISAIHEVTAARPRTAEFEDTPEFFAIVTALRESLRRAMETPGR